MIVIDASVAVKWYQCEAGQEAAAEILEQHFGEIFAPDLFLIEVNAALVRHANMHKPAREPMQLAIARFRDQIAMADVVLVQTSPARAHGAAERAIGIGHPLKDCLYLALAMELGCPLVTADARFAAKARGVWDEVRVLGE